MKKHFMHSYAVTFTTPRRCEDSLGELTGYDNNNPVLHHCVVRIVAPEVGYKAPTLLVEGYLRGHFGIDSYANLTIEKVEEPLEIDTIIAIP